MLSLLALIQGRSPEDQIGYHRAFERMVKAGRLRTYQAIPYRQESPFTKNHWAELYARTLEYVKTQKPDLLLLQWFHGDMDDPRPFICRARAEHPGMIVITTCGDPFDRWFLAMPRSLRQAASVSDLTFSTSMGYLADNLVAAGARNVVLMPNGACQERFTAPLPEPRDMDCDLVFIGSNNGGRNPFTHLSRAGRQRKAMILALERRYGSRFALYGRGWEGHPSWRGPVPYADQQVALQKARVQVGGFPGSYATYYTSDRFYIALSSGVPLLDALVPGVEALAEPGEHWVPYQDIQGLLKQMDQMLDRPQVDLDALGGKARDFILGGHTQAHRAEEMVDIAQALREARAQRQIAPPPRLHCFHPGVDPAVELPRSVRNWHG